MKEISYQRVLKFLLEKRAIESYVKFSGKAYQIADSITGTTSWCDFVNQDDWGECTNAFQKNGEAEYLHKSLFNIDIEAIKKEHSIKIDEASIPSQKLDIIRGYPVNTP